MWSLGRVIVEADPLERADAIYVLGGSRVDRAFEAALLYRDGYASHIVMSQGAPERGERALERQGIHVPNEAEIMRDVLVNRLGIPATDIDLLPQELDNTAAEAGAIAPRAHADGWRRLIVITDRASTRRAAFAFRRALGPDVAVTIWCSRDDRYDAARWWNTRAGIRQTLVEAPKLLSYWLGLKG